MLIFLLIFLFKISYKTGFVVHASKNDPVKRKSLMQKVRGKNCWNSVLEEITGTWDLMHGRGQTLTGFAGKMLVTGRMQRGRRR